MRNSYHIPGFSFYTLWSEITHENEYSYSDYTLESFLQELPPEIGPTPAPSIQILNRENSEIQEWIPHIRGWESYGNYSMQVGDGYLITVNQTYTMDVGICE